jgi:hypothetical protein
MELHIGDKGPEVGKLQEDLGKLGYYHGRMDREYGRITESAVREYQRQRFVTGTVDEVTLGAIARDVAVPHPIASVVEIPHGLDNVARVFGQIQYVNAEGGRIKITNGWSEDNTVAIFLPVVGKEIVHKKLADVFFEVFEQVQRQGLSSEVRQFAVWAPRHKMNDPSKPLSLHSWAIACDVNWSENPPGHPSRIHPGVVQIFEAAGFTWGAKFHSNPDPMHFQWATGV